MSGAGVESHEDAIDRRPDRSAVVAVGVLAAVAVVPLAVASAAAVVGLLGAAAMSGGTSVGSDRVATVGLLGLLAGSVLAGWAGAPPTGVLVSTAAALVAWDGAVQAIDLGRTLGRQAETGRALTVHVAATAGVAALVAALGYAAFRLVGGEPPVTALVLLLVGGVALAAALRA
jgi:hypothetical protein